MREMLEQAGLTSLVQTVLSGSRRIPESEPEMDVDQYYNMLSNPRRRHVIRYMDDFKAERPFELGFMSRAIAALENGKMVDEVTSAERKNVYVGLYQVHLNQLDDAEVIDYDQDRGILEFGPNFDLAAEGVGDSFYDPDEVITMDDLR